MTSYSPPFSRPSNHRKQTNIWPKVRSDSAIEEEIWERLSKETGSIFSPDHIAVDVEYGQARLSGHVREAWQHRWAEEIAAKVRGVTHVRNEIIPDEALQAAVMRALSEDERTAAFLIPVKCSLGWITLGGVVPTLETCRAAEEVSARTAGVRGILGLPWVVGLPWTNPSVFEPARRAFQPGIGAAVYDGSDERQPGCAGRVAQVIIDPRSRLISHLAVRLRQQKTGRGPAGKPAARVIPASAIEAANREHVWLKEGESIQRYPVFHTHQYPLAPQDWQPPFPYQLGTVRWPWR